MLRFFDFLRAEPTENSVLKQPQAQTFADADECMEARKVCKVLSNSHMHNLTEFKALRIAVGNNQADYLFSRFSAKFGWTDVSQAQRFYDQNKGSKGGWY